VQRVLYSDTKGTRIASSHIRVGTFQYFAARGDRDAVERLADYVIDRHFPDARDAERPRLALLQAVVERQALLIARWMHVGFIHGVMNKHVIRIEFARHDDRQTAPRELVDHGQHAKPPAVLSAVLHEVVGPHVVRPLGPETDA
jgi:hypothetical protein